VPRHTVASYTVELILECFTKGIFALEYLHSIDMYKSIYHFLMKCVKEYFTLRENRKLHIKYSLKCA